MQKGKADVALIWSAAYAPAMRAAHLVPLIALVSCGSDPSPKIGTEEERFSTLRRYAGVSFSGGHATTFTDCGTPAGCTSPRVLQCDLEFSERAAAQLRSHLPPYGFVDGELWLELIGGSRPQADLDPVAGRTELCVIRAERVLAACGVDPEGPTNFGDGPPPVCAARQGVAR